MSNARDLFLPSCELKERAVPASAPTFGADQHVVAGEYLPWMSSGSFCAMGDAGGTGATRPRRVRTEYQSRLRRTRNAWRMRKPTVIRRWIRVAQTETEIQRAAHKGL